MKATRTGAGIVLAALTIFATQELYAQFGSGGMGGGMGGGMRGGRSRQQGDSMKGGEQRRQSQQNILDDVEYRLDLLQEDLKLKPEQFTAWAAFSDKTKAYATDLARERSRGRVDTPGTALQQINHAVDTARNHVTALEDIAAAAKALYDGLSPEQKTLADSRLALILPSPNAGRTSTVAERSGRPGDQSTPAR